MRRALMRTTSTKARRVGDVEVRLYGDDIDLKELWRRFLVLVGKPNGAAEMNLPAVTRLSNPWGLVACTQALCIELAAAP